MAQLYSDFFRNCAHLIGELVCLAFLYARFRFLIWCLIYEFIQGGSDGLTLIVLFGIHSLASDMRSYVFCMCVDVIVI